jgi:ketosteroid isomerase-like protein
VRVPGSHVALALTGVYLFACLSVDTSGREEARRAIAGVLDSIATAISNRDANAIAAHMPTDSSIVYVSDGRAIRGTDLRSVLQNFYSGLRSLSFRWDSVQLVPLGDQTWDAVTWARIAVTDSIGHTTHSLAIFTWTIVRQGDHWVPALAHKATLP